MIGRLAVAAMLVGVIAVAARGAAAADTSRQGGRLEQAWQRGNEAYLHGDYAAAVAAYEGLEHQGIVSSDLYFNLGDAYFRSGALGRAIWAFERATLLDPGDDDARYNLTQARKLAATGARDHVEGEEREPTWIRAVTALAPSTESWLFAGLYVGFFVALFAFGRVRSDFRPVVGTGVAVLAVGAAMAGLLLFGRAELDRLQFGVVLPDAVAVKEGADVNYRTSFDLHAGLKVRIVEQDQDWVRVRLGNGLEGWVRATDIGRL